MVRAQPQPQILAANCRPDMTAGRGSPVTRLRSSARATRSRRIRVSGRDGGHIVARRECDERLRAAGCSSSTCSAGRAQDSRCSITAGLSRRGDVSRCRGQEHAPPQHPSVSPSRSAPVARAFRTSRFGRPELQERVGPARSINDPRVDGTLPGRWRLVGAEPSVSAARGSPANPAPRQSAATHREVSR